VWGKPAKRGFYYWLQRKNYSSKIHRKSYSQKSASSLLYSPAKLCCTAQQFGPVRPSQLGSCTAQQLNFGSLYGPELGLLLLLLYGLSLSLSAGTALFLCLYGTAKSPHSQLLTHLLPQPNHPLSLLLECVSSTPHLSLFIFSSSLYFPL
jgi:hypothetical protein